MEDKKKKKKDEEEKIKKEDALDWVEWGIDSPLADPKLKDTDKHPVQKPDKKDDDKKKKK